MLSNNLSTELSNSVELLLFSFRKPADKSQYRQKKKLHFWCKLHSNAAFNLCYRDEKDFFVAVVLTAPRAQCSGFAKQNGFP